jgi:DNA end-binding protein Ku
MMSTLRSADEVCPSKFGAKAKGGTNPEMVTIAETIIERQSGAFEPASVPDRYQDALRELVEAKTKGLAIMPRALAEPLKIINSSGRAIVASSRRYRRTITVRC